MRTRDRIALLALAAVAAITAVWWALALWPLATDAPDWLVRTRAVCFGAAPDSLPDAAGWMALVGQPVLMLGLLALVAGDELRSGLRALAGSAAGRVALVAGAGLVLAGAGLAGARVADARGGAELFALDSGPLPSTYPRLDRPAPPLRLVDQHGDTINLARFHGRPVLLTFAFAHCATICPLIVKDVLAAQRERADAAPVVLVVTLDPWRDTPSRLPHIARSWALERDAFLLGGDVETVESTLDAWNVPRSRDERTGDVTHPALVYLLDRDGGIAYATTAGRAALVDLLGRILEGEAGPATSADASGSAS